jgi:hypothetical protein
MANTVAREDGILIHSFRVVIHTVEGVLLTLRGMDWIGLDWVHLDSIVLLHCCFTKVTNNSPVGNIRNNYTFFRLFIILIIILY